MRMHVRLYSCAWVHLCVAIGGCGTYCAARCVERKALAAFVAQQGLALAHLLGVPTCRMPGWQLQLTRPASVMEGSAVGVRLA
jgi:hypothetical protein